MPCWAGSPCSPFFFFSRSGRAPAAPPTMPCASPKPPPRPMSPGPITGEGGAVLDCNPVYRRMAGVGENETPPPPELALAGEPIGRGALPAVARCRRRPRARGNLCGGAGPGDRRRGAPAARQADRLVVHAASGGQHLAAAGADAAPRLSRPRRAADAHRSRARRAVAAPVASKMPAICSATRPWAWPLPMAQALISDANAALAKFFGASAIFDGAQFREPGRRQCDRAQVTGLIARAAQGRDRAQAGGAARRKSGDGDDRMAELFASPMSR